MEFLFQTKPTFGPKRMAALNDDELSAYEAGGMLQLRKLWINDIAEQFEHEFEHQSFRLSMFHGPEQGEMARIELNLGASQINDLIAQTNPFPGRQMTSITRHLRDRTS